MKESKELLDFIFSIGDGIKSSLDNDGRFTMTDVPHFIASAMKGSSAINDINKIPMEIAGMTQEQKNEIIAGIKERFDYVDDVQLEMIYESLIIHGLGLSRSIIRLFDAKK